MVAVTVAQLPIRVGEPDHNRVLMRETAQAAPRGILVFPELSNSGYCFRDRAESRALAEPADGPSVRLLCELSSRTGSTIVTSLATRVPEGVANVAVVVEDGRVIARYRKVHLWGAEPDHFVCGTEPAAIVRSRFGMLGVMVCYDLEFPEFTRGAALAGADLIVAPVNWPDEGRPAGERPAEQVVVQAAARTSRVAIAVCDRTGAERIDEPCGSDWVGGSIIVGQAGYPLTPSMLGREAVLTADVDLAASRDKALGPRNDTVRDRRPELYRVLGRVA